MFEKSTWIRLPRSVVVGHGVLDRTVDAVEELYLDGRPLLVTSPTPEDLAADRLVAGFEEAGFDPAVTVVEEAAFSAVEEVLAAAREVDAGFLIGLGGGKPIDIAKMAADEFGWRPSARRRSRSRTRRRPSSRCRWACRRPAR